MRLEKIKIAGFKSFVDPTTVPIPSQLVGVVGPNGCGKSNTIDAVRWVMGESSAKMLRGESMADVIFNGSTSRKPVGMASVELVFDNSKGTAGGQYASFNQISVKRRVQRDGQSQFYLNGSKCRRRDITDLFMGTGLGPRSYSIIEQGMISRLIEARPEDLRAFLEEAAGISKYKDRRKETERRIQHTRENLERLVDLIEEVEKQLIHLKKQAETAEKYKKFKAQERLLKAELIALKLRAQQEDFEIKDEQITQHETAMEKAVSEQRALENQQESEREKHQETQTQFNLVQGQFYQVGSEIAQTEQSIKFAQQNLNQLQRDLQQNETNWQEAQAHLQQDEQRLHETQLNLSEETPHLEALREKEALAKETLDKMEAQLADWQQQWEHFNHESREPTQVAQVERTRMNHFEQQGKVFVQREQKIQAELQKLAEQDLSEQQAMLQEQVEMQSEQQAMSHEQLNEALAEIEQYREKSKQVSLQLNEVRSKFQSGKGRLSSLEALQASALGRQQGKQNQWLKQQDLLQASRLAEQIKVTAQWQRAVETVLGHHLQAVCVDDISAYVESLQSSKDKFTLIQSHEATQINLSEDALLHHVTQPIGVQGLLAGVRCANSLPEALAMRHKLPAHESYITPQGEWIGVNWIKMGQLSEDASGVLERGELIKQLLAEQEELEAQIEALQADLEDNQLLLKQSEQSRQEYQQQSNDAQRQLSALESRLSALMTRLEQNQQREMQLQEELQELNEQHQENMEQMAESRITLHAALEQIDEHKLQRETLLAERDRLSLLVKQAREETQRLHGQAHDVALRIESFKTLEDQLTRGLDRMRSQLEVHVERRASLQEQLEETQEPLEEMKLQLEEQLQQRVEVETHLTEAREALEQSEKLLRGLDQQRHQSEQLVQQRREALEKVRAARQESLFHLKNLEQQLLETDFKQEELMAELAEDASVSAWEDSLRQMDARIKRLGAINLAAIDEYKEQEERMHYLNAQQKDITESLETLENAIRKIDRETRTKFKETYDKVNTGLKERFPKLFGGGHAYLSLTGEDLLDTGVTVMARPPGKRNTSIHLLSGGEKALTAVALVFSIFDLNPSPFCMLDEVDAPLDDANVGRFCELVKSMSDKVQFIFITHNKITMEIANQLMGVTMHEPGVSRLVSVDVEQAAEMVG